MKFPAFATLAALAGLAAALPAAAATEISFGSDAPATQTIVFNGFTDSYAKGKSPLPGLGGSLTLSLLKQDSKSFTFGYSLANLSGGDVTGSRLTVFGFDFEGDLDKTIATSGFTHVGKGNVPMGFDDADICFRAGSGGKGCSGGGNGGVGIGQSLDGQFTLVFDERTSSVTFTDFFARFQGITASSHSIGDASGVGAGSLAESGGATAAVPEPATWAMLIAGFGLVGASFRRRRTSPASVSA